MSPKFSWYENHRRWAQGELLAAVDLMLHGYEVFRAVDPVASTDLIAHHKGRYWRVQVKTGRPETTETKPGHQEVIAWVDLPRRTVEYDPGLPALSVAPVREETSDETRAREVAGEIARCVSRAGGTTTWFARFRCQNQYCDVRTFEVYVKEFDY